jgi:hypothetical protein
MSAARPRVLDARELAVRYRTTFTQKPLRGDKEYPFTWPTTWHHVGDTLAIAYASDKINPEKPSQFVKDGDYELYKHLAESRNRVLCQPDFLVTKSKPRERWPVIGPMVSLAGVPMPKHFALLGFFEEADLRLHTAGTDEAPRFGRSADDGVVQVELRHAYVGGSKVLWSRDGKGKDQPFLTVFTESSGPLMLIFGDELDIERDGIVG